MGMVAGSMRTLARPAVSAERIGRNAYAVFHISVESRAPPPMLDRRQEQQSVPASNTRPAHSGTATAAALVFEHRTPASVARSAVPDAAIDQVQNLEQYQMFNRFMSEIRHDLVANASKPRSGGTNEFSHHRKLLQLFLGGFLGFKVAARGSTPLTKKLSRFPPLNTCEYLGGELGRVGALLPISWVTHPRQP